MANIRAAQTGNFSDTTTWVGGVVPTAGDNVYSNTYTVTIDTNITVAKISNIAENTAVAGGKFVIDSNVIVNGNVQGGATVCLEIINDTSPTINGNIIGGTAALGRGVTFDSTGVLYVSGNATGGTAASLTTTNNTNNQVAEAITNLSTGTIQLTGNVNGGTTTYPAGIVNASSGSVYIYGGANGGSGSTAHAVRNTSSGFIYLSGDSVGGNSSSGIASFSTGNVTVDGDLYAGSSAGTGRGLFVGTNTGNTTVITINGNIYGPSGNGTGEGFYFSGDGATINIGGSIYGGTGNNNTQRGAQFVGGSNHTINITGNVTGGYSPFNISTAYNTKQGINSTSGGIINITGEVNGGPSTNSTNNIRFSQSSMGINHTGSGTINITGDQDTSDSPGNYDIQLASSNNNGVVNLTGNITANSVSANVVSIYVTAGTLNITGNIYGKDANVATSDTSTIVSMAGSNATVNIIGIAYAGISGHCVRSTAGTCTIKKAVGGPFGVTAVTGQRYNTYAFLGTGSTSKCIVEEVEVGQQGNFPIAGPMFMSGDPTKDKIKFRNKDDYNVMTTFIDPLSSALTYPLSSDVRFGVSYAAGNLTGSCYVPSPSSVSYNIPVDNTVGQVVLSINDLLNFDVTEIGTNSIWKRLKNCSTVASTGNQMAALV